MVDSQHLHKHTDINSITQMGFKNKHGVDIKDIWNDGGISTYLGMTLKGLSKRLHALHTSWYALILLISLPTTLLKPSLHSSHRLL